MKSIAVIALVMNALLLLAGVILFAHMFPGGAAAIGEIFVVASALNMRAALDLWRIRQTTPLWRLLTVACDATMGAIGFLCLFSAKPFIPALGCFTLFISLTGIAMVFMVPAPLPAPGGPEEASKRLFARAGGHEKWREAMMALGIVTGVFGGVGLLGLLSGRGTVFAWGIPPALLCLVLWWHFGRQARRERYAGSLAALGAEEGEALKEARREMASGRMGAALEARWRDYESRHREAIDRLEKDLNDILSSKYRLKPEALPVTRSPGIRHGAFLHHAGKTAEQAAEDIHRSLIDSGHEGNPKVFVVEEGEARKRAEPSTFNKIFFGAYSPTGNQKIGGFCLWFVAVFFIYGAAVAFAGPKVEVFVPSEAWLLAGKGICAVLATAFALWCFWARRTGRQRRVKIYPLAIEILLMPLFLVMAYGFLWMAIVRGTGEALTEIFGEEAAEVYEVVRDEDTSKSTGRGGSTTAYCVESEEFEAVLGDEFCRLLPAHHAALPKGEAVPIIFVGPRSVLGFVARAYLFSDQEIQPDGPVRGAREFMVGVEYLSGRRLPTDRTKGEAYIRAAAEKGYAEAQYLLGIMHAEGDGNIARDMDLARTWLYRAVLQGHDKAVRYLEKMGGD